jgi:hypothetical protein
MDGSNEQSMRRSCPLTFLSPGRLLLETKSNYVDSTISASTSVDIINLVSDKESGIPQI